MLVTDKPRQPFPSQKEVRIWIPFKITREKRKKESLAKKGKKEEENNKKMSTLKLT